MSDLISREKALDDKGLAFFHYYDDYSNMRNYLKAIPSADIMECARAIKEYCKKNLKTPHFWCESCPLYEVMCQPDLSIPSMWDLPEGEKEGE